MFLKRKDVLINVSTITFVSISVDDALQDYVHVCIGEKEYISIYPHSTEQVEDVYDKVIKAISLEEKIVNV